MEIFAVLAVVVYFYGAVMLMAFSDSGKARPKKKENLRLSPGERR